MEILAANATFVDGTSAILRVPPGHIDIHVKNLEIKAGLTTSVTIDIMADKAQIANEGKSGKANLNPQFKTIVSPPS